MKHLIKPPGIIHNGLPGSCHNLNIKVVTTSPILQNMYALRAYCKNLHLALVFKGPVHATTKDQLGPDRQLRLCHISDGWTAVYKPVWLKCVP